MNPVVENDDNRRRALLALLAVLLVATAAVFIIAGTPGADAGGDCTTEAKFLAYDAAGVNFGPAATGTTADEQYGELQRRLCLDPALTVATEQYLNGMLHVGNENRVARTNLLLHDRVEWQDAIDDITARLDACAASSVTMSGDYQTLAMRKGTSRDVIPVVFQTPADAPSFGVLRFQCGSNQFNFKLNCGFQPVAQSFPGVPREASPPTGNPPPPSGPPGTTPPGHTPTTRPPGGCPTGPDGCKDPADSIGNDPDTCALGDCGPRPVAPTPPPADPVQPTPTVQPPANPPPPPDDPGPTQPTVTVTVPSPDTAPG